MTEKYKLQYFMCTKNKKSYIFLEKRKVRIVMSYKINSM